MNTETLQGALRMLFLLDEAGSPPAPGSHAQQVGAVAVIFSEKKLQALHFWMRNPDYLAYEILTCVERGELESSWTDQAEELLRGEEPELRRYPMLRHRFGAYEPIDDSFSHLVAAGLADCYRYGQPGSVTRTDFYLLEQGREQAQSITGEYPELEWYPARAALIAEVSGNQSGSALKRRQYELSEYAETMPGDRIQPIASTVRQKLKQFQSGRG